MNEQARLDRTPIPFIDVGAQRRRLGDAIDVADEIQPPGADDQARGDVAQDRGEAQEAEQRDRDDRGGQQDGGFGERDHGAAEILAGISRQGT